MPESMIVNLKDEFELTHESDYVRNKLSTYRQNVGSEIKRIRLQLNLSQIELAEKAGISQSHVCRLEKGVHVPEHSTIERIATAMDVSPSQIDPGFTDE